MSSRGSQRGRRGRRRGRGQSAAARRLPVINLDGASSSSDDEPLARLIQPTVTPTKQKLQTEHITCSPYKMSRGIMSDSSDSEPEPRNVTILPSPAPRVPPHVNNSSSDNSDDIFNIDYSSHNQQALKGAYKEFIVSEGQNNTAQSTNTQAAAPDSDDDCKIIDNAPSSKTRQKEEDSIEDPPSPTLFELSRNTQKEESTRTTRKTKRNNRRAELEGHAKRRRASFGSPFGNDSLLNISSDIVSDNEDEEEEVNPEMRLRIMWDQESFRLPIRKLQKFSHLYEVLAEKYGVSADRVVLSFNDKILNPALCPADLNLTIVDIIEGGVGSYTSHNHPRAPQPITCDPDSISLRVQNSKKKGSITINISLKEKMSVLMHKYAEEKKLKLDKLRFMFDGEPLSANSTPSGLDLEGGECIDVFEVT